MEPAGLGLTSASTWKTHGEDAGAGVAPPAPSRPRLLLLSCRWRKIVVLHRAETPLHLPNGDTSAEGKLD